MTSDSPHTHSHSHGDSRSTRREARELALRMLFQLDLGKQPVDEVIEAALGQSQLEGTNREYAEILVRETLAHLNDIDPRIAALTPDWTADRQAVVDRNILRLASYELLYRPDAPVAAVVNEAVELAKKYSTAESGRFVNGVLGALARQPRGEEAADGNAKLSVEGAEGDAEI
ncbi:MAG: transcription antitermination factor NusB [Janthinobacterium lividum]